MSNYHVEPADEPKALTTQAIKAMRRVESGIFCSAKSIMFNNGV